MFKRLMIVAMDFGKQMTKKNIGAFAANTAFFLFLSLFPVLMLLCAIIPYTPLTEANLMSAVTRICPDNMDPFLVSIISDVYDKSLGIISITIIGTIWSAGKGVLALMQGLNAINDVEENRNYLILRAVACLYTVLVLAAVLLSLFVMVFGDVVIGFLEQTIPQTAVVIAFLMHFRIPFIWLVTTIIIALMYTYVPGTKMKFRIQLPGAAFAAVSWSVITWGFSVYINWFNGFNMYGSLTTIVILLLWLYSGMNIIMLGAYLNRYFKPAFQFFIGKKQKRK